MRTKSLTLLLLLCVGIHSPDINAQDDEQPSSSSSFYDAFTNGQTRGLKQVELSMLVGKLERLEKNANTILSVINNKTHYYER